MANTLFLRYLYRSSYKSVVKLLAAARQRLVPRQQSEDNDRLTLARTTVYHQKQLFISDKIVTDLSKKDQLYELIRANPFISQQDLAVQLRLSRSAVAGHIAGLIRERRLLGRAYVLPGSRPIACIGAANLDRKLRSLATLTMGTSNPARQDESFGGVARNIAENLARLGAPVSLTTAIGDDSSGRALLAHAEAAGIDTRGTLKLDEHLQRHLHRGARRPWRDDPRAGRHGAVRRASRRTSWPTGQPRRALPRADRGRPEPAARDAGRAAGRRRGATRCRW